MHIKSTPFPWERGAFYRCGEIALICPPKKKNTLSYIPVLTVLCLME